METVALAPGLDIPRIINGMWQVAGAHGAVERNAAIRGMTEYHRAGLVAWDMADIYGPAEEWYGAFRDGGGLPHNGRGILGHCQQRSHSDELWLSCRGLQALLRWFALGEMACLPLFYRQVYCRSLPKGSLT